MKQRVLMIIGAGALGWLVLTVAWAQSLDELRVSGAVVERFDGFAEALQNSPAVQAAVNNVNAKRRKIYQERAQAQGVSADQVGRVYAQEIFDSAPAGTQFLRESGEVVTK